MTKYVSGIVQGASPNVGEGRIRPAGRSLGTPVLESGGRVEKLIAQAA